MNKQIRNPNLEIRNKFKLPKRQETNRFGTFPTWISDLFRIAALTLGVSLRSASDFDIRI